MKFNIITVTRNSESIFTLLFELLNTDIFNSNDLHKILIIDNNSNEDFKNRLLPLMLMNEKIKLLERDKNYLYSDSNNFGIKWSIENTPDVEYFVLLNPDISAHPLSSDDIFSKIIKEMIEHNADLGSCKLVFNGGLMHGMLDSAGCDGDRHIGYGMPVQSICTETNEVSHLDGALMVLSKAIIKDIGILDYINYPHWTSDTEFGIRANLLGYKAICTPYVLFHECGSAKQEHHIEATKDLPDGLNPKKNPTDFFSVYKVAQKNISTKNLLI
jgi:GT2 family glycosyltransferase